MELKNQTILLISPEFWGINFVSKHHYAIELVKRDNKVYYLNPPSKNLSLQARSENLYIVDYKPRFRGLSKIPAALSAWLIKKEITRLEQLCNTSFDIIWNFDSSRFFNLKLLPSKILISHIVDLSEDKNIKLLNRTADFCLCTTNFILQRQKKYNINAFNIGHGCTTKDSKIPFPLNKKKTQISVGYLGNLLIKYLDWELIFNLVTTNPDVSFYFAGPYKKSNLSDNRIQPMFLQETINQGNTHFLGSINPRKINSYLSQMDILLLTYKTINNKEQLANPHKLLEYMASGKVVVSSWIEEYKDKKHLLEMVEDNTMLHDKFIEVISNLDFYNKVEEQKKRMAWAKENTYENKIEQIEYILNHIHNLT